MLLAIIIDIIARGESLPVSGSGSILLGSASGEEENQEEQGGYKSRDMRGFI